MKDLIILTDLPITYRSLSGILKKEFKNYTILNDSEDLLYIKKKGSGFELEFSPDDILSNPDSMMEDTVDKCPNKNAYLTNLNYTSVSVAKRIIRLIINSYGNMWIQSDESDDWFGTAEDFLKNYSL